MKNRIGHIMSVVNSPSIIGRVRGGSILLLLFFSFSSAFSQVEASEADAELLTGAPIFSHGIGYAGEVEYKGEMIPWFVLSDVY
ncbi:MAG: hypothetical protein II061_05940, partial [Bacteroidaceae bacterium]|nr:hypothetical protein [Bacteroidaceae bacterium]